MYQITIAPTSMRYRIAILVLGFAVGGMLGTPTIPDACFAVAALVGLWLADWMDMQEAKQTKPTKNLLDLETSVEALQKELTEMKGRVSTISIAHAAKPFMKR